MAPRRIVACVNFLDGVPNDVLEHSLPVAGLALLAERDRVAALNQELVEALTEMIWIWDCDSVQGVFQLSAIRGMGPTAETPRIVAGVEQARAVLAKARA